MDRREVRGWIYQFVPPVHRPANLEVVLLDKQFDGRDLSFVTKEELMEDFGFSEQITEKLLENRLKRKVENGTLKVQVISANLLGRAVEAVVHLQYEDEKRESDKCERSAKLEWIDQRFYFTLQNPEPLKVWVRNALGDELLGYAEIPITDVLNKPYPGKLFKNIDLSKDENYGGSYGGQIYLHIKFTSDIVTGGYVNYLEEFTDHVCLEEIFQWIKGTDHKNEKVLNHQMAFLIVSQLRDILFVNVKGADPAVGLLLGKTYNEIVEWLRYISIDHYKALKFGKKPRKRVLRMLSPPEKLRHEVSQDKRLTTPRALVVKLIALKKAQATKDQQPYLVVRWGTDVKKTTVCQAIKKRSRKIEQRFAFTVHSEEERKARGIELPENIVIELWNQKMGKDDKLGEITVPYKWVREDAQNMVDVSLNFEGEYFTNKNKAPPILEAVFHERVIVPGVLRLEIMACKNVKGAKRNKKSDVQVEAILETERIETDIVEGTTVMFKKGPQKLQCVDALTDKVRVIVHNNDGEGHTEDVLGACEFTLEDIVFSKDLTHRATQNLIPLKKLSEKTKMAKDVQDDPKKKKLKRKSKKKEEELGEVALSLMFTQSTYSEQIVFEDMKSEKQNLDKVRVFVTIVSAENLPIVGSDNKTNPFVQLQSGEEIHTTEVLYDTVNPTWQQEFSINNVDPTSRMVFRLLSREQAAYKDDDIGSSEIFVKTIMTMGGEADWDKTFVIGDSRLKVTFRFEPNENMLLSSLDKSRTVELQCIDMYVVDDIIGDDSAEVIPFKPAGNYKKEFNNIVNIEELFEKIDPGRTGWGFIHMKAACRILSKIRQVDIKTIDPDTDPGVFYLTGRCRLHLEEFLEHCPPDAWQEIITGEVIIPPEEFDDDENLEEMELIKERRTIYQNVIDQSMLNSMLSKDLISEDLRIDATQRQLFQVCHSKLLLPLDRIADIDKVPANEWTTNGLKFLCRYRKRIEFTIERTEHYITPNKLSSFLQVFVEELEQGSGFLDLETSKFVDLVKNCTDKLVDMDHLDVMLAMLATNGNELSNRFRWSFLKSKYRDLCESEREPDEDKIRFQLRELEDKYKIHVQDQICMVFEMASKDGSITPHTLVKKHELRQFITGVSDPYLKDEYVTDWLDYMMADENNFVVWEDLSELRAHIRGLDANVVGAAVASVAPATHTAIETAKRQGGKVYGEYHVFYQLLNKELRKSVARKHIFSMDTKVTIARTELCFTPSPQILFWMEIKDDEFQITSGKYYHEFKEFHFKHVSSDYPDIKFPTLKFYEGDERHQKDFGQTNEAKLGKKGTVEKIRRRVERYIGRITFTLYDTPAYSNFMIPNMSPSASELRANAGVSNQEGVQTNYEEKLVKMFEDYDVDGGGALDREEFAEAAHKLGIVGKEVESSFKEFSEGADEITFEQFKKAMMAREGAINPVLFHVRIGKDLEMDIERAKTLFLKENEIMEKGEEAFDEEKSDISNASLQSISNILEALELRLTKFKDHHGQLVRSGQVKKADQKTMHDMNEDIKRFEKDMVFLDDLMQDIKLSKEEEENEYEDIKAKKKFTTRQFDGIFDYIVEEQMINEVLSEMKQDSGDEDGDGIQDTNRFKTQVRHFFIAVDEEETGQLGARDFIKAVRKLFGGTKKNKEMGYLWTDERIMDAFRRVDEDNSQSLEFNEFHKAMALVFYKEKSTEFKLAHLRDIFDAFDVDESGELDFEEFCELMKLMLPTAKDSLPEDRLKELFKRFNMDKTGDFQIRGETISWTECKQGFLDNMWEVDPDADKPVPIATLSEGPAELLDDTFEVFRKHATQTDLIKAMPEVSAFNTIVSMEVTIPGIGYTINKQPEQQMQQFRTFEEIDLGEDEHYLEMEYETTILMEKNRKEGQYFVMIESKVQNELDAIELKRERKRQKAMKREKKTYAEFRVSQEINHIKSRKKIDVHIVEERAEHQKRLKSIQTLRERIQNRKNKVKEYKKKQEKARRKIQEQNQLHRKQLKRIPFKRQQILNSIQEQEERKQSNTLKISTNEEAITQLNLRVQKLREFRAEQYDVQIGLKARLVDNSTHVEMKLVEIDRLQTEIVNLNSDMSLLEEELYAEETDGVEVFEKSLKLDKDALKEMSKHKRELLAITNAKIQNIRQEIELLGEEHAEIELEVEEVNVEIDMIAHELEQQRLEYYRLKSGIDESKSAKKQIKTKTRKLNTELRNLNNQYEECRDLLQKFLNQEEDIKHDIEYHERVLVAKIDLDATKMIEELAKNLAIKVSDFLEVDPDEQIDAASLEPFLKDIDKYDEQTKELQMLRFFDMHADKGDPTSHVQEDLHFMEMAEILKRLENTSVHVGILELVEEETTSNALKMAILWKFFNFVTDLASEKTLNMKNKHNKWSQAELKLKLTLRMSLIILFAHTQSAAGNWEMIEEDDLRMMRIGIYRWQEAFNRLLQKDLDDYVRAVDTMDGCSIQYGVELVAKSFKNAEKRNIALGILEQIATWRQEEVNEKLFAEIPDAGEDVQVQFENDIIGLSKELLPSPKHTKWLTHILMRNYAFLVRLFQTYAAYGDDPARLQRIYYKTLLVQCKIPNLLVDLSELLQIFDELYDRQDHDAGEKQRAVEFEEREEYQRQLNVEVQGEKGLNRKFFGNDVVEIKIERLPEKGQLLIRKKEVKEGDILQMENFEKIKFRPAVEDVASQKVYAWFYYIAKTKEHARKAGDDNEIYEGIPRACAVFLVDTLDGISFIIQIDYLANAIFHEDQLVEVFNSKIIPESKATADKITVNTTISILDKEEVLDEDAEEVIEILEIKVIVKSNDLKILSSVVQQAAFIDSLQLWLEDLTFLERVRVLDVYEIWDPTQRFNISGSWNEKRLQDRFVIEHGNDNSLYGHILDGNSEKDLQIAQITGESDQRVVEITLKFLRVAKAYEKKVGEEIICFGVISVDGTEMDLFYTVEEEVDEEIRVQKRTFTLDKEDEKIPLEERIKFHHSIDRRAFIELVIRVAEKVNPNMAPFEAVHELVTKHFIFYAMDVVEMDMENPGLVRLLAQHKKKIRTLFTDYAGPQYEEDELIQLINLTDWTRIVEDILDFVPEKIEKPSDMKKMMKQAKMVFFASRSGFNQQSLRDNDEIDYSEYLEALVRMAQVLFLDIGDDGASNNSVKSAVTAVTAVTAMSTRSQMTTARMKERKEKRIKKRMSSAMSVIGGDQAANIALSRRAVRVMTLPANVMRMVGVISKLNKRNRNAKKKN